MSNREIYGPDGRRWWVNREPVGDGFLTKLLRSDGWQVTAVTEDEPSEARRWTAQNRATANALLEEVALSLRTGTEGPLEP